MTPHDRFKLKERMETPALPPAWREMLERLLDQVEKDESIIQSLLDDIYTLKKELEHKEMVNRWSTDDQQMINR